MNNLNESDILRMQKQIQEYTFSRIRDAESKFDGKPSKYNVNLISLGRLGSEFSEILIRELGLNPSFLGLDIWHRIALRYQGNAIVEDSPNDSKARINEFLVDIMTKRHLMSGEKKHNLHEYRTLKDLEEIVKRKHDNPSIGDITVVASRYDFSFDLKNDKKEVVRALDPKNDDDFRIIENIIQTSVYGAETFSKDDIVEMMMNIKRERDKIKLLIDDIVYSKKILELKRAKNLIDSVIGVRELGKAFRGYTGNVILAVNEVDTTHTTFCKSSLMYPGKVDTLCDNDQIRNEEFLIKEVEKLRKEGKIILGNLEGLYVPTVGSHNEHCTPISELIGGIDGALNEILVDGQLDINQIRKQTVDLGEIIYNIRGSSDKDASLALFNVVESIMFGDKRIKRPVRSSVGFTKEGYSIGLPIVHDCEIQVPQLHMLRYMNVDEKGIFERGAEIQKYINKALADLGILPGEWKYDEFKPQVPQNVQVIKQIIEVHEQPRPKSEIKKNAELHGTIYYTPSNTPLIIQALNLPEADMNKQRRFKAAVKDPKYDDRISLGKILLDNDKIFVHGTYDHKDERRGHLIWFNSKEHQSNGHINPIGVQAFEADRTPLTHLYLSHILSDTAVFYEGKMYFLTKEQDKARMVMFDPENPKDYRIISNGVANDEALLSLAAVNGDLIIAGNKNLYKLHHDRFKRISEARCKPRFMRSIPDERAILYSDAEKGEAWYFELDSVGDQTRIPEGPYFELSQKKGIVLASTINEKVQRIEYEGLHDLKRGIQRSVKYSPSIPDVKRIIIPSEDILLAIAQEGNNAKIYTLDKNLECSKDVITLPSTSYSRIEVKNE